MNPPKKAKGAAKWATQFAVDKPESKNPQNLTEIYKERFFLREFKELESKLNHRRFKKRNSKNVWKKIGEFRCEFENEYWYLDFINTLENAKTFKDITKHHNFLKGEAKRLAISSGYTDEETYYLQRV